MSIDTTVSNSCPRCQMDIPYEQVEGMVICSHCGWTPTDYQKQDSFKDTKPFLKSIAIFSAIFLVAAIHMMNWNEHSFSIIPLKVKSVLGMTSLEDMREIAKICTDRLKYDCVDSTLSDILSKEANAADYIQLGDLRRKLEDHERAIVAYNDAIKLVTDQLAEASALAEANYGLAKSYEALKNFEFAARHYQAALAAKPEVIQITVTESYIRLLQSTGRTDEIKRIVDEARKRSGSENLFGHIL